MLLLFASCKHENKTIVQAAFIDSLISNYSDTGITNPIETNFLFWKKRIDPLNPGFVNELQYAAALVQHFHVTGDINDLVTADSILCTTDKQYNHKEAGPNLA